MKVEPGEVGAAITYVFSLAFFLFLLSLLSGCGDRHIFINEPFCTYEPEVGRNRQSIIDGEIAANTHSTVQLKWGGRGCTGTLVGPRTVVTAAHCTTLDAPGNVRKDESEWVRVDVYQTHPDHDLAVLQLSKDLPPPYVSIAEVEAGCFPGMLAQGQGYTQWDDPSTFGVLREATVFERVRFPVWIWATTALCYGDSGGPLYAIRPDGTVTLIGVAVSVSQRDCLESSGYVSLLEELGDWVRVRVP